MLSRCVPALSCDVHRLAVGQRGSAAARPAAPSSATAAGSQPPRLDAAHQLMHEQQLHVCSFGTVRAVGSVTTQSTRPTVAAAQRRHRAERFSCPATTAQPPPIQLRRRLLTIAGIACFRPSQRFHHPHPTRHHCPSSSRMEASGSSSARGAGAAAAVAVALPPSHSCGDRLFIVGPPPGRFAVPYSNKLTFILQLQLTS